MNDFDFSIFESESSGLKKKKKKNHFTRGERWGKPKADWLSHHNNIKEEEEEENKIEFVLVDAFLSSPDFLPATKRGNNNKWMKKERKKEKKIYE